jgi:O-antigen/teichoic acid export membrane protein
MSTQEQALAALPKRGFWHSAWAILRPSRAQSVVVGGSLIMLAGYGLTSAANFFYNVVAARLLGPSDFGHAAAVLTLLMLASAVTLSFQMVCSKFVARSPASGARSAIYAVLLRRSWLVGVLLAAFLALLSWPLAAYLRLPSVWLVVLLAVGVMFYVPLGVRRGGMQGVYAFPRLASNFLLEAVVKLGLAVLLIWLGYGVFGAVGAIVLAVVAAYFLPLTPRQLRSEPEPGAPIAVQEGTQAIVFFVGLVIMMNIDILLVKHLFAAEQAGLYAAVALVGRLLFYASWAMISAMFPVSASAAVHASDRRVVVTTLLFVLGLSLAFLTLLIAFPGWVVHTVFGPAFLAAQPLLGLYAAATALYALAVTLMAYEMSRRIANTAWLQLLFSGLLVGGIYLFHGSLREVILVQLVLMAGLLIAVSVPFLRAVRAPQPQEAA